MHPLASYARRDLHDKYILYTEPYQPGRPEGHVALPAHGQAADQSVRVIVPLFVEDPRYANPFVERRQGLRSWK
jgi:hypothetical protein